MKKTSIIAVILLQCLYVYSQKQTIGDDFLSSIEGTYDELFTREAALNPKYDKAWVDACDKLTEMDNGVEIANITKTWVSGTLIGEEAVKIYKGKELFFMNTSFRNNIAELTIKGNNISGKAKEGKEIFSHEYRFLEYNQKIKGNIYKSVGEHADGFMYVVVLSENSEKLPYIKFRYGDSLKELKEEYKGKYAYWMAYGIVRGDESHVVQSIQDFCKNELSF